MVKSVCLMKKFVVTIILLTALSLPSCCFAVNYDYTYGLLDHLDGSTTYRLTVSVTSSLYDYYRSKDHSLHLYDFAKFVTPTPLKPIADNLLMIYSDDEDFANGVLMIVHQIPYVESGPQKYPIETIVENEGDCDLFSFVAASIMKAGGLDVVLLLYEAQSHMNVGVHLSQEPEDARFPTYYYSYEGKRYYVAECTGDDWRNGWRVGECPDMLKGIRPHVITLEDCEQSSPGQVSSSYGVLASSSLFLSVSSRFVIAGRTVTVSGSLTPALPGKNVTIYVCSGGSSWSVLVKVVTDSDGRYSFTWSPSSAGTYSIRAGWSGDEDYAGADSNTCVLSVVSMEWLLMGIAVIVSLGVLLVAVIATRRKPPEETEILAETEVFKE
ncbi:MAG: Ig-like domain-containing protein [Candidatus Bathyarchaeaceae archaeon]